MLQDSSLFMDALEAGSKSTSEPRKRKRSGLVGSATTDLPVKSQDSPATAVPPAAAPPAVSQSVSATVGEASPVPVKPMFNVNEKANAHLLEDLFINNFHFAPFISSIRIHSKRMAEPKKKRNRRMSKKKARRVRRTVVRNRKWKGTKKAARETAPKRTWPTTSLLRNRQTAGNPKAFWSFRSREGDPRNRSNGEAKRNWRCITISNWTRRKEVKELDPNFLISFQTSY